MPHTQLNWIANLIWGVVDDELRDLYVGGKMLTLGEDTLQELAAALGKRVAAQLYAEEINSENYGICKADRLLKSEGGAADDIVGSPEHPRDANDAFLSGEFDFMLANPAYGKSWNTDRVRTGSKNDLKDRRFLIQHGGDAEHSLVTRLSDHIVGAS
jgi:type I restriction enzyme M protein